MSEKKPFWDASVFALLLANIITLYIALSEGLSLSQVLWVYWGQSVIIGFFYLLRILLSNPYDGQTISLKVLFFIFKIFTAGFFVVHYGIFHAGYALFLSIDIFSADSGYVVLILELLETIKVPLAIFFVYHLFSFTYNYQEDKKSRIGPNSLMFYPYIRIIPMHLFIVFGLFFVSGTAGIVFFLSLKTTADLVMHHILHKRLIPGRTFGPEKSFNTDAPKLMYGKALRSRRPSRKFEKNSKSTWKRGRLSRDR